jgi:DedD protein
LHRAASVPVSKRAQRIGCWCLVLFRQLDWRCNGFGYTDFLGAADAHTRSCYGPSARLILVSSIPIVDIQAKDRLTGAVILVALVVLLVPALLSGPGPKLPSVAASPSEGAPLRSYTVELGDDSGAHRTAAATAAASAPAAVLAAPTAAAASTSQPLPAPPQASEHAQAPPQAAAPQADAAAAASHPKPAAVPEPAPVSGWMIQLGSFASRANAERLVHELKANGYAAFLTESANGGRKLYRVRVGPAADHATAQAWAAKLRASGHPGSLTSQP